MQATIPFNDYNSIDMIVRLIYRFIGCDTSSAGDEKATELVDGYIVPVLRLNAWDATVVKYVTEKEGGVGAFAETV